MEEKSTIGTLVHALVNGNTYQMLEAAEAIGRHRGAPFRPSRHCSARCTGRHGDAPPLRLGGSAPPQSKRW